MKLQSGDKISAIRAVSSESAEPEKSNNSKK